MTHLFCRFPAPFSGLGGRRSITLKWDWTLKRPRDRDRSSKRFEVYRKVEVEHEAETYSIEHVEWRENPSPLRDHHSLECQTTHYLASLREGTKNGALFGAWFHLQIPLQFIRRLKRNTYCNIYENRYLVCPGFIERAEGLPDSGK